MQLEQQLVSLDLSKALREVEGYEGLYGVSGDGKIFSLARKNSRATRKQTREMGLSIKRGYLTVTLSKKDKPKTLSVHRIVAKAFIPNPKNLPQINHIDGNKLNNNISNLEWCNCSENQVHARKNGLMGGERANTAKLTERDVRAIRRLCPKVSISELSRAFDVKMSTISQIIKRNNWKYVKP